MEELDDGVTLLENSVHVATTNGFLDAGQGEIALATLTELQHDRDQLMETLDEVLYADDGHARAQAQQLIAEIADRGGNAAIADFETLPASKPLPTMRLTKVGREMWLQEAPQYTEEEGEHVDAPETPDA